MGYRIEIKDSKNHFYGTKHYGYCDDKESELDSFKYLVSIGKFKGDEHFDYWSPNPITVSAEEFRKFIKLYDEEHYKLYNYSMLDYDDVKALYNSEEDKNIE